MHYSNSGLGFKRFYFFYFLFLMIPQVSSDTEALPPTAWRALPERLDPDQGLTMSPEGCCEENDGDFQHWNFPEWCQASPQLNYFKVLSQLHITDNA